MPQPAILLHGGAGVIPEDFHVGILELFENLLSEAASDLQAGQSARAVAVRITSALEDFPQLNAGRGATYNRDGQVELDASLMLSDRQAGAVGSLKHIQNPIQLANTVLGSEHLMLVGQGAELFAQEHGFALVENSYFRTPWQDQAFKAYQSQKQTSLKGTVGVVVRDNAGHLAAATSTGGGLGKRPGRLGDSPIIGAGTYASAKGACSCSGDGEYFIRALAAYRAVEMQQAGHLEAILSDIQSLGGQGGFILMPAEGPPQFAYNTPHMAIGMWAGGEPWSQIARL